MMPRSETRCHAADDPFTWSLFLSHEPADQPLPRSRTRSTAGGHASSASSKCRKNPVSSPTSSSPWRTAPTSSVPFFAYHDALMEKPSGLSKAEREMIVVATSGANQCQYCVVAHGAILRLRARNPLIADQVASQLPQGRPDGAAARDARFCNEDCAAIRPRSATPILPCCASTASRTKTSGTSAPSPHFSRCRTGWRI
jgi:AhpD family alkylhydroperoxidase